MAKRNTNGFGLISRVGPRSKELEYQLRRSAHVANIGTIRIKSDWCLSEAEAFESWSMKRDKRISDHCRSHSSSDFESWRGVCSEHDKEPSHLG